MRILLECSKECSHFLLPDVPFCGSPRTQEWSILKTAEEHVLKRVLQTCLKLLLVNKLREETFYRLDGGQMDGSCSPGMQLCVQFFYSTFF